MYGLCTTLWGYCVWELGKRVINSKAVALYRQP